jgi:hypothetical protein
VLDEGKSSSQLDAEGLAGDSLSEGRKEASSSARPRMLLCRHEEGKRRLTLEMKKD